MGALALAACALGLALPGGAAAQRPVIERIQPTSGPPGTRVQIVGRGFSGTVLVGGEEAAVVQRLPYRWTVEVARGARTGRVVFRTSQGDFAGPVFRVTQAAPPPRVTALEPSSAPPGAEVTLHGENFAPRLADNIVFLGGRPVVVRSGTPTSLRVIVPTNASSGPFTVRVQGAGETQSPPFEVSVGTSITAVEPAAAPPGTEVTLRGTGFSGNPRFNRVHLAGRRVRVRSASPTELVVAIPRRGARSGSFTVDVRGAGRATSAPFTVLEPLQVRGFEPTSGPPGTLLTIHGSGFGRDVRVVRVTVASRPLQVRRVRPNMVQAEVRPNTPSGPVVLEVGGQTQQVGTFQATGALAIQGFQPRSGAPGTVVTIRGSGFAPNPRANRVLLGGVEAQVVGARPNQLRVRAPSAPSGPFEVHVGSASARSSDPFVVTQPPFIADFQPRSGPVGTQVTLRGRHFGQSPGRVRVELGGRAMRVLSVQDDALVVEVPRGARTARIAVNVGTQGGAATPEPFRVEAHRAVSALQPSSGFPGTEVTIRGQGFPRRGLRVQFAGAAPVQARRVSPVELRVVVPQGARSGPVSVLLPNGRTMPAGTFSVSAAPSGTAIQTIDPRCAYPGCLAVLRGHGFASRPNHNRVRFRGQPVRVRQATPTTLTIQLPRAPGNGRFELNVRGGGEATSPPFMILRRP
ncbi:MAG TPA: IPT/TIG domain-containing protein [Polyangiaceae bacterium LLY-WYZ-15_(1-7)]|nr:IPT/TIG domain-containing protein [Polyangiaceae bacterium LLY-WYZ-15_(1-7)]HJL10097.1 IPT/TIG domain-containing protein [Polyangiaceae bacterium LLY-WYZ-15_(1-7)]HJL38970.1 IPT/TIG domain-containing protein [Polyangiaceae bacterium LLY-WYZ-15_(1-7)]HJL50239.1 IPT/TIG domain-containing protein [Polyangiaceae bacterium LLY-WYZ-15_(1-7)]